MDAPGLGGPEQGSDGMAAELVRRLKRGDQEAFLELYDLYAPALYAYLRLVLADRFGAAQATQDLFEHALDALPERSPVPIRVWLLWLARHRAKASEREFSRTEPEDGEDELFTLITRLPLRVREALILHHVLGFSLAEAAIVMDRSPRAVGVLERRGIEAFGRLLLSSGGRRHVPPGRLGLRIRSRESPVACGRRLALASG